MDKKEAVIDHRNILSVAASIAAITIGSVTVKSGLEGIDQFEAQTPEEAFASINFNGREVAYLDESDLTYGALAGAGMALAIYGAAKCAKVITSVAKNSSVK